MDKDQRNVPFLFCVSIQYQRLSAVTLAELGMFRYSYIEQLGRAMTDEERCVF